jgi:hypothetical protein
VPPAPPEHRKPRSAWLAAAIVVAVHAAVFALVAPSPELTQGRAASDAFNFHEPSIRAFAAQWPAPDLSNYFSATTPLYHLVLAAVCRFVSDSRVVLMAVGAVPSAVLFAWAAARSVRRLGLWTGLAVGLCLPASLYVLPPAIWLLPDNAGWLGVLAVLALALSRRPRAVVLAAGVLLALVLTRQVHIWAAAPIWAAAWLGTADPSGLDPVRVLSLDLPRRARRLVPALLLTLPAFAALAWFVRLWGGLTVPRYQLGWYSGWNPATPAFFLALFGLASAAFIGFWWPGLVMAWRSRRVSLAITLLGAAAIAIVPATTYTPDSLHRISGLWNAARALPSIAGHTSPAILLPALFGAVAALGWACSIPARSAWVLAAGAAGFVAAQTASPLCWQRYHEPFVLLLVILLAGEAGRAGSGSRLARLARVAGPLGLALALAAVTALAFRRDDVVTRQLDYATNPPTNLGDIDAALAAEPVPGLVVRDSPPPRDRSGG